MTDRRDTETLGIGVIGCSSGSRADVVVMVAQSPRQVDSHRQARRLMQDGNIIETVRNKICYNDPQVSRDLLRYGLALP